MFRSLFCIVILSTSLSTLSAAPAKILRDEAPVNPTPGYDKVLFGDSARTFFEKKIQDTQCVGELAAKRQVYEAGLETLDKLRTERNGKLKPEMLVAETPEDYRLAPDAKGKALADADPAIRKLNDALDAAGKANDLVRDELVILIEKCGECSTQDVVPWTVRADRVEPERTWYVSDGSCQLLTKDTAELKAFYEIAKTSLLDTTNYLKFAPGGFDNILNFNYVSQTGPGSFKFEPEKNELPIGTFKMAIWVLGPKIHELFPALSFRYLMNATTSDAVAEADGIAHDGFRFTFTSEQPALVNRVERLFPKVGDWSPAGRPLPVSQKTLFHVIGQWYVNEDGYARYYTAAQFPIPDIKEIETLGRRVLRNTVTELVSRTKLRMKQAGVKVSP